MTERESGYIRIQKSGGEKKEKLQRDENYSMKNRNCDNVKKKLIEKINK